MLPLVALLGPTASGKTALSLALAQRFGAHILSCDSVCVYRHMELGTAKPTAAERALVPHHLLDLYDPPQPCTAGDYARHARAVLAKLAPTGTLPILAGGTGLYARALFDGLFPSPATSPALRQLLRARGVRRPSSLHRSLLRIDAAAAARIHPNDTPKLIRALEVSVSARRPLTQQWTAGRDALTGYRILRLTLAPPRDVLYQRINARAAAMFRAGLVDETHTLIARFGPECRPFAALGYAQAAQVLRGELTEPDAIAAAQQGHRNYAKRQLTWFRREATLHPTHWLEATGDSPDVVARAAELIEQYLTAAH